EHPRLGAFAVFVARLCEVGEQVQRERHVAVRLGQRFGRLSELALRQLELAGHDEAAAAFEPERRRIALALDRARQCLERVADAPGAALRGREPQHGVGVRRIARDVVARLRELLLEPRAFRFRQRWRVERFFEQRQRLGLLRRRQHADREERQEEHTLEYRYRGPTSDVRDPTSEVRRHMRRELKPMLALAAPVVLAELGWITMGIVDTLMVGRLGASAIGAVGLASMLFFGVGVFAMGVLLGLDPLVAQNFGAGRVDECHRWLVDGVWLGVFVAVPTVALIYAIRASLGLWGLPPDLGAFRRPYLGLLPWRLPPLLLVVAFRRYLQAMHLVRPITIALLSANLVNAIGNWLLIFGHLGFPAMGVRGSAWATLIARVFMAAFLFV